MKAIYFFIVLGLFATSWVLNYRTERATFSELVESREVIKNLSQEVTRLQKQVENSKGEKIAPLNLKEIEKEVCYTINRGSWESAKEKCNIPDLFTSRVSNLEVQVDGLKKSLLLVTNYNAALAEVNKSNPNILGTGRQLSDDKGLELCAVASGTGYCAKEENGKSHFECRKGRKVRAERHHELYLYQCLKD